MIDQSIIDIEISRIMKEHGAFFAFSNEQFERQRDPNILKENYTNIKVGMICPTETALMLICDLEEAYDSHAKTVLRKYTVDQIIRYELNNHEIDVTGDITDTVDAVAVYGITEDRVREHCKKRQISIY